MKRLIGYILLFVLLYYGYNYYLQQEAEEEKKAEEYNRKKWEALQDYYASPEEKARKAVFEAADLKSQKN